MTDSEITEEMSSVIAIISLIEEENFDEAFKLVLEVGAGTVIVSLAALIKGFTEALEDNGNFKRGDVLKSLALSIARGEYEHDLDFFKDELGDNEG